MMSKISKVLNTSNLDVKPDVTSSFFKFHVGLGNNFPSVIHALKLRSWWHKKKSERFIGQGQNTDDESDEEDFKPGSHFIWTQWC